jgi:hypothetical protein
VRCAMDPLKKIMLPEDDPVRLKHVVNVYTVSPVLNGPFIKRNFALNGNIFRSRDYHITP